VPWCHQAAPVISRKSRLLIPKSHQAVFAFAYNLTLLPLIMIMNNNCTFHPPALDAWIYAVSVHGACCVLGAVPIGILLYRFQGQKVLSLAVAFLAAASVPLGLAHLSSKEEEQEQQQPWIGPFLASTFGFVTFFKSINAGFGQYPHGADETLATWLMWFVLMPEPQFAKGKLRKASAHEIRQRLLSFVYKVLGLCVVLSILLGVEKNYRIQLLPDVLNLVTTSLNGVLHIWLIYLWASFCLDFSALANTLTTGGVAFEPGFLNPLLESRSLKEAWGLKWNLPTQALLQRISYVPLREQGYGRGLAAIGTFFVSGLLHEYNFSIHNHRFHDRPGTAVVFFVLMGMIMLLEKWVWDQLLPKSIQDIIHRLPSVLVATVLTVLASVPFEHYFIPSWLDAGMVECLAKLLPHITCE
jgi:hypothetical protein